MKASEIIGVAAEQLNDTAYARWTQAQHFSYLTEGLRLLVSIQPRALSVTTSMKLAAGTKQELPASGVALIDIVRNLGATGNTPGYAVTVADRQTLDAADPGWHTAPGGTVVDNYTYDDRSPTVFYVNPPVSSMSDVYVEIVYAEAPAVVSSLTQDLAVMDVYQAPLVEYQLYRCYSLNSEASSEDRQAAQTHLGVFYAMLGEKEKAAMLLSPNNPNNVVG